MARRILWLIPLFFLAAHAFFGIGPGDYRQGYDQAVQDLEEARTKLGWASEFADGIIDRVQHLPPDSDQSIRWNKGYQQAVRDHFDRR